MSIIHKTSRHTTSRRSLLKLGGMALAAGIAAPHLWIPRVGHAKIPASKKHHVLIYFLDGGARSVPMFNAGVGSQWNPLGAQAGSPGTEWAVGKVFVDDLVNPSLLHMSHEICVLGTCDHTPGEPVGVGDHAVARNFVGSGYAGGGAGLLSLIHGHHKSYTEPSLSPPFPPVLLGAGDGTQYFGVPKGGALAPVKIPSYSEFAAQKGNDAGGQPEFARALEDGLDLNTVAIRSARDRFRIDQLRNGKAAVQTYRDIFLDPVLAVAGAPAATMHGLSNAELATMLGPDLLSFNTALALRFIGFGSAAVVVGDTGWDTHSGESAMFAASANRLGRTFAGLSLALKALKFPDNTSYWDNTLVLTISEFGRDNLMPNGYNSGGGSDHTGGPGSRYQAYACFGGLVDAARRGKLFGATDSVTMEPKPGEPVFSTRSILAMVLGLLDIDPAPHFPEPPLDILF
jgi:hypothetical protein